MFHRLMSKAYLVAFTIMVVCLMPSTTIPSPEISWEYMDKLVHVIIYIPLAWTLYYGFKYQNRFFLLKENTFLFALIIASLYGALMEFLQFVLTQDRAAEFLDIIADMVGVLIGLLTSKVGVALILFWNKQWNKYFKFNR